jgi:hypothetical protein
MKYDVTHILTSLKNDIYTKDHQFINVCGKHLNQTTAMEDQNQREKQIIAEATDILVKKN